MSDTASKNPTAASRRMADALLRSVGGTTALFRVAAATSTASQQAEIGLSATSFAEISVSPVVLRQNRPNWLEGMRSKHELLISATSIYAQVNAMSLASANALFQSTLAVNVAGQDYLIESVGTSEAFGQVYLYRLLVREVVNEAV